MPHEEYGTNMKVFSELKETLYLFFSNPKMTAEEWNMSVTSAAYYVWGMTDLAKAAEVISKGMREGVYQKIKRYLEPEAIADNEHDWWNNPA